MADTASVQVIVKTTADTTGLKDVVTQAKELAAQGKLTKQAMDDLGVSLEGVGRGKFTLVANEAKAVTSATQDITQETKKAAEGMDLFKINTSKALGETQVLIRELATGSFHARTLGSLLSALGPAITAGGIAAILLFEAVKSINDTLKKLQENADAFNKELDRAIEKWSQMAKEAESIGDQVHLADAIHSQVQKAQDELDAFIKKNKTFSAGDVFSIFGTGQLEIASQLAQNQDRVNNLVKEGIKALNDSATATTQFNAALERVYGGEGQAVIDEWTKKVQDAQAALTVARVQANISPSTQTLAALDKALENYRFLTAQLKELEQGWNDTTRAEERANAELERMSGLINEIIKKNDEWMQKQIEKDAKAYTDKTAFLQKMQDEAAVRRATGNDEVSINTKVAQLEDNVYRSAIAIKDARGASVFSEKEARAIAQDQGESLRQQLETVRGTTTAQSGLNVEMKEYETILQNIRQQQQVTQAQAFIGPDQKNLQLLQQYRSEIVNIINAMRQQEVRKNTLTDPAEIARANQELQKFSAQYQLLAAKIITTTHQFQAGLQSWADSFGSTGTQLANTLQQTVGVALQSFNQWIVTGKFNMQQLLQSIAQLGLQLVEQLIIQRVVAMINARLAETQAVASSKIIAAAWASAATAVTIATEGEAAYSAPGAVAIALGGVQAALGLGSLHEGGPVESRRMHSGGLAHDEVPIIAQEGEIMINRDDAAQHRDLLLAINAGMYHSGGFVAGDRYHGGSEWDKWADWFPPGEFGGPMIPPFTEPLPISQVTDFGPPSTIATGGDKSWGGDQGFGFSQLAASIFTPGYFGPAGTGWFNQGPTMIPTTLGSSGFPMAVPLIAPDYMPSTGIGGLPGKKVSHSGGLISRFHSGGPVGGGGGGGKGGGGVHIYAFTDLKQLTKHMASRDGQKIIFDTVKGRRIDLGIS